MRKQKTPQIRSYPRTRKRKQAIPRVSRKHLKSGLIQEEFERENKLHPEEAENTSSQVLSTNSKEQTTYTLRKQKTPQTRSYPGRTRKRKQATP
ncbi:hypothetical protein ElyMa_002733700 [Elysia marginata]|uniref:Uncharacterized protein n=1 Tax=Elysia marginata TaxID=1093978 RepID=A0AAV4HHB6_9GAST|nr:hypothetical protein ElyMa_002733700 [Elysia marginata]